MAKLTEKKNKTETEKATAALVDQFKALSTIADIENEKPDNKIETESQKKRKDQLVTFTLPVEDFDKYKKWFGSKGISMSMGLRICLDYIYYQDEANRVVLSKSGIRENNFLNLK